jgi:hypothetical protein
LPSRAVGDGNVDVTLEIEEPGSPVELGWSSEDDRPLGVLVRTVTLLPAEDEIAKAGVARERRRALWAARGGAGKDRLRLRPRETVELADLSHYGGFGAGWILYPDQAGIWTEGSRSELALELGGTGESDHVLVFSLGSICVKRDASLRVEALVNGKRSAARDFGFGDAELRIDLPATSRLDGKVDLAFIIEEPSSPLTVGWSADHRPLGILVRAITLEEVDRSVKPGEKIVFGERSGADRLLGNGWSRLEPMGVWTDGDEASLVLRLMDAPPKDAELILGVTPFVTADHPELEVEASALGERLAHRVFRHGKANRLLRIPLPAAASGQAARVPFELRLCDPARPADLGLGGDERSLGLHLQWLLVGKIGRHETLWQAFRGTAGALRRRLA